MPYLLFTNYVKNVLIHVVFFTFVRDIFRLHPQGLDGRRQNSGIYALEDAKIIVDVFGGDFGVKL